MSLPATRSAYPLISVITVTYNAEKSLEQCMNSVLAQTYEPVEYIIIDGGSTDATLQIIKQYQDKIAFWQSEPDHGIYDAMNKGIKSAKGDVIYFLNADDYFAADNVLETIASHWRFDHTPDILYGNIMILDEEHHLQYRLGKPITAADIRKGRMISHQAMFTQKNVFTDDGLFDTRFRYCADYALLAEATVRKRVIKYVDYDISCFRLSGVSSSYRGSIMMLGEMRTIIGETFPGIPYIRYHAVYIAKLIRIYGSMLLAYCGLLGWWRRLKVSLGIEG